MAPKFLVATDFSTRSDRALRRAGLLARQFSAGLSLVHVVDDDRPERLIEVERRQAEPLLLELCHSVQASDGAACGGEVVLGDVAQTLARKAEEMQADLLIVGPHRKEPLRDTFFGTTAERTIRTSRRPVLMANGVPAGPYRHILLPTDFSISSLVAARAAQRLGLLATAEITALHVLEPEHPGPVIHAAMTVEDSAARLAEAEKHAKQQLDTFVRELGIVAAKRVVGPGEEAAGTAINGYAAASRADLIVVGTHGRSGFENWLLGSVAENVLSHAAADVLAVPGAASA